MIKLVGLDLDGTILNSLEDLKNAVNYALEKEKFKIQPIEKVKEYIGNGVYLLLQRASNTTDENKISILKQHFDDYYSKHYCDKSVLYNGAIEFLKKLDKNNIKIIIYSNKPDEYVKAITEKLLSEINIHKAIGQCNEYEKKPNAEHFKYYQNKLGIKDEQTVYIGDSDVDIKTAKNAGVNSIGVTWGYRDLSNIEKENPDFIVNDFVELEKTVFYKL